MDFYQEKSIHFQYAFLVFAILQSGAIRVQVETAAVELVDSID